jgi:hypothetical protein
MVSFQKLWEVVVVKPEGVIYRDVDAGVAFVWSGGPYIDIYWSDAMAIRGPQWEVNGVDAAVPFTNINVWDYGTDRARISGREEFEATCREWLEENRGNLGGYLEQSL